MKKKVEMEVLQMGWGLRGNREGQEKKGTGN